MGRERGGRGELALNLATGGLLIAALAFLGSTRLLPAWQARLTLEEGERLTREVRLETLAGRDTVLLPHAAPALLLVYQSTCPACRRELPAWGRLLEERAAGVRVFGVALEPRAPGLAYAREHLPDALAVRPVDEERFARVFGLEAVPTTLFLDGGGGLRHRTTGRLRPGRLDALLEVAARGGR